MTNHTPYRYEIGMILRSRIHGGTITLIGQPREGWFNCLNKDSNHVDERAVTSLRDSWMWHGSYNKTVKLLYEAR